MTEEILDRINEQDEVIGEMSYDEIHQKKLLHRVVHLLIFNKKGELLLQLRSAKKSAYPLCWGFSVGGHVRHGESYQQALVREVREEIEIDLIEESFTFKGKGTYTDEHGHSVVYQTFETTYDGPIEATENEEIAALQFVSWSTLRQMIAEGKEKLQPEFVEVMKRTWGEKLTFP